MTPETDIVSSQQEGIPKDERAVARYVYAEANLATIGYYDAGYKRRRPTLTNPTKVVKLPDGRVFKMVPTVEYGFPNTEDLDIQRAFESVLLEQLDRRESIDGNGNTQRRPHFKLPISVSIGEILRRSGRADTREDMRARDKKAVRDWVRRHTATTIEGPLKLGKPGEPAGSFSTHLFNESYVPGDTTKRGDRADTIMLWPAGWYLSNLSYNFTYLIDASFHEAIGRHPVAKNLYPVLLAGFLAADPHPFKKSYRDTMQLFGMPIYPNHKHRERQLTPSFDRLTKLGFLDRVAWSHRDDDTIVTYWPGPKAAADIAAKKARREQAVEIDQQAQRPTPLPAPTVTDRDDQAEAQTAIAAMLAGDLAQASGDHASAANWRYLATKCVAQRRPHLVHQAISELKAADNVENRGAFLNSRLRDLMQQFELFPSAPRPKQGTPLAAPPPPPSAPAAIAEPTPVVMDENARRQLLRAQAAQLIAQEQGTPPTHTPLQEKKDEDPAPARRQGSAPHFTPSA